MQFSKIFSLTLVIIVMALLQIVKSSPVRPLAASRQSSSSVVSSVDGDGLKVEMEMEALANLPSTNSRSARTSSAWFTGGLKSMRRGKLLNLHKR